MVGLQRARQSVVQFPQWSSVSHVPVPWVLTRPSSTVPLQSLSVPSHSSTVVSDVSQIPKTPLGRQTCWPTQVVAPLILKHERVKPMPPGVQTHELVLGTHCFFPPTTWQALLAGQQSRWPTVPVQPA